MILGRRPKKQRPPKRWCEECGGEFYAWTATICPTCVRSLEHPTESWRAFRKRVIEKEARPE